MSWIRRLIPLYFCLLLFFPAIGMPQTHGYPNIEEWKFWAGDAFSPYISADCLPTVPSSSLTLGAFTCSAYVRASTNDLVYTSQSAATVTLANTNGNHWLAICRDTSSTVGGWTRRNGSRYVFQQTANQPADPTGCVVFAKVTVAASVISAVAPVAYRGVIDARLTMRVVSRYATGGTGTSSSPWTGWESRIDWTAGNQAIYFPAGYYTQVAPIVVSGMRTHIRGAGKDATTINYAPTAAPGTTLAGANTQGVFTFGNTTASVHFQSSIRDLSIVSTDTTYRKIGLTIIDASEFYAADIKIGTDNNWTGVTSRGLWLFGRELGTFERLELAADLPIEISDNPNSTIDIDHYVFRDLYLLTKASTGASGTNPCILIEGGVNLSNVSFEGSQAWVKGSDGLYWQDLTTTAISNSLAIRNVRWEQSTATGGYMIRIEHNYNLDNLILENIWGSVTGHGIRLRKVLSATLRNIYYQGTQEALNIDESNRPVVLENLYTSSGTVGVGALVTIYDAGQSNAGYIPLRVYDNSAYARTTINAGLMTKSLRRKRATLTYSASMTPDARDANIFTVEVTDGNAMTINQPSNGSDGDEIVFTISNQSGGAMGAITWAAQYKLGGAFTNPATGNNRSIWFIKDNEIPNGNWHEISRTSADVAN